jgi:septum formation protein
MGTNASAEADPRKTLSFVIDSDFEFRVRTSSMPPLILASSSPRRQSLLSEAGYTFTVHPADIDEENFPATLLPSDVARHLALAKAEKVSGQFPDAVILAADTVVAFGDTMLSKPKDANDARRILSLLSGTTHIVITGLAVHHRAANFARQQKVMSAVHMRAISNQELDRYIESGQWQGKAGAYGIQDPDPFVTRLAGSQSNIVGLPMQQTRILLAEAGIHPRKIESPDH